MEDTLFTSFRPSWNGQRHVHEIVGSTQIAEECEDPHNHRFVTVSDEAVRSGNSHVHNVKFRTDFYEDHYHEFCGVSSPAIPVDDGRHVHFCARLLSLKTDTGIHSAWHRSSITPLRMRAERNKRSIVL